MINVSDNFHNAAFGQIIQPILKLYISFDKSLQEGEFFTLNKSQLNGPDLLKFAASNADTQSWDFYNYVDFSDRLVSVNWERELQFPYQIQCGMADFTLSNTDAYFTPLNPNSSIGDDNLPGRPSKIVAGFNYVGSSELVPQMLGITEGMPDMNYGAKTASYHMVDFLYDICQQTLKTVINMRNARTDEVIAAILQSYGLAATQYNLAQGRYRIPFVFFDIGDSIGDALKRLVQAENGFMWLDETGVVRFASSIGINSDTDIVATLSDYHIMSLESGELSDIVNHVKVKAELRELQEYQEVYTKSSSIPTRSGQVNPSSLWLVRPGETYTVKCNLSDPCYDVVAPTINKASSVSWFTAFNPSTLEQVTYGVTATGTLSSKAFTITFTNNNNFQVAIDEIKLWGEPAKVYDVIDYDAYDDESVAKYGDHTLEISDNQFFQNYGQANSYARTLIRQRREYNRTIKANIKGNFAFQLLDLIKIDANNEQYNGVYRIMGISYEYNNNQLITRLVLNGANVEEGVFTLNISQLNGKDKIQ